MMDWTRLDKFPGGDTKPCLQIGEVVDRTGVTHRTLRFYEERGLLKPPTRMEGGYRLYSENHVRRVERIKRMQSLLGLTLAEIKEMMEAEEVQEVLDATTRPDRPVEEHITHLAKLIELTQRQFDILSAMLDSMVEMRRDLETRLKHYSEIAAELTKKKGLA